MIKITFRKIAMLSLLCASPAFAGSVTGNLQTPNGLPVKNGTLNFTLAQAGLAIGSGSIVPATVACYTSTDGTVVGVPNPLSVPQGSVNASSGTLAPGTYYVQETLYNGTGESLPSPELTISVPSGGTLTLNAISNFPATATGMRVYVGSTSGSETLQGSVTSGNYSLSVPLVAGTARPTANTSTCQITFNDTIIPYTGYKVSLLSSTGGAFPGWPQQWQLNGGPSGTVNISQGAPLWDGTVVYPTPILATPLNHGPQSISGPLDFGGYNVSNVGALTGQSAVFSGMLQSAVDNGVINPAAYPGNDLAQQITAAITANATLCPQVPGGPANRLVPQCTLRVPPGVYTIASGEIYVAAVGANTSLLLDGATLIFTGPNVRAGVEFAPGSDHVFIHGGLLNLNSATNAVSGLIFGRGIQGCYAQDVREQGVAQGDGFLNLGCNVGTLLNNEFASNLIGVHMLGSPGYASNNIKVLGNIITGNQRWGIVDGDVSQYPIGWPAGNGSTFTTPGVSSPNFNNLYLGNDLELNNLGGGYGAVETVLTDGDVFESNYFEATNMNQIMIGSNGYGSDAAYQFMYTPNLTGPQVGDALGTQILNNYFTAAGGNEITLVQAYKPTITGNTDQLSSVTTTCFVNAQVAIGGFVNNNAYQATNQFCIGGTATTVDGFSAFIGPDTFDLDLATAGSALYFNSPSGIPNYKQFVKFFNGGPPVPTNPNNPGGNPHCSPAYDPGSIINDTCTTGAAGCTIGGGVMWQCVSDDRLTSAQATAYGVSLTDGFSTWIAK